MSLPHNLRLPSYLTLTAEKVSGERQAGDSSPADTALWQPKALGRCHNKIGTMAAVSVLAFAICAPMGFIVCVLDPPIGAAAFVVLAHSIHAAALHLCEKG